MKIIYTKHAINKFTDLKKLGIIVKKKDIRKIIENPDNIDMDTDPPKIIATGNFGKEHILRVVYRNDGDIIITITFYPARKGRYFS